MPASLQIGKAKSPHREGEWASMDGWVWAVALKPFVALFLVACFGIPARLAVQRWMRDGKLKRFLLFRVGGEKPRRP